MEKIIGIGSGRSLAKFVIEVVKQLDNVKLTLFVRNRNKHLRYIVINTMNYGNVKDAVTCNDIGYINLAGNLETMRKDSVKPYGKQV